MNTRTNRLLGIAAVVLGVALLAVAVIYWVQPADALPGFFPGYEKGSGTHHVKHGIAAAVVALGLFAYAWFRTAPDRTGP